MLSDDTIFAEWFNDTVSLIQNFKLTQPPHEAWFSIMQKAAIKRPWIYSKIDKITGQYVRSLTGDYAGHIVLDDIAYAWDKLWNVYTLKEWLVDYDIVKIFNNATPSHDFYEVDTNGEAVKQNATVIDYLSWYLTQATVATGTTNSNASGDVVLKVSTATFTPSSVGNYIYFPVWSIDDFRYQIRQIIQYVSATEVYLNEMLYWDHIASPTLPVWQVVEIYSSIDKNVVFNNIKDSSQNVLTYDINWNAFYMRSLWGKDVCVFDGKYRSLSLSSTSVSWSLSTWEFEIIDIDLVFWAKTGNIWENIVSMTPYENYIVVFYNSRISVIWKIAIDSDKKPIYNLNEIHSWFSAEWCDQVEVDIEALYFYSKRKSDLFRLEINADNNSTIKWKPISQGTKIKYLMKNKDEWFDIRRFDHVNVFSDNDSVYILADKWVTSIMYEYNKEVKWRLTHKFSQSIRQYHTLFYDELLMWCNNLLCFRKWSDDLWNNIEQKIVITGPKQWMWIWMTVLKVKMLLAYYWTPLWFEITQEIWWSVYLNEMSWDDAWVEYVNKQNIAASSWALGTLPLWYSILWANNLKDKISKLWLVWFDVWKSWVYYVYTITNTDKDDLNIYSISVLFKQDNPATTPTNNNI